MASTVPLASLSSWIVQPASPDVAGVFDAVAVDVVELHAADRAELEVAEVVAGAVGAADDRDVARIDGRLSPADLAHFANAIGAGGEAGEAVVAAGAGDGRGIDGAVGVFVELDRPASEAGIGAVLDAVAVVVLELLAADARRAGSCRSCCRCCWCR